MNILAGYNALLATCKAKAPEAKIIVTAILPRNDNKAVMPEINRINAALAKLADDRTVLYVDVNDKLADADGNLFEGMTIDQLHLTAKGYQVWVDGLRPVLMELLGRVRRHRSCTAADGRSVTEDVKFASGDEAPKSNRMTQIVVETGSANQCFRRRRCRCSRIAAELTAEKIAFE